MAATSSNCLELFKTSVKRVLDNWTALQLAVDHGMGGPQGQLTALNLVDYIMDLFNSKSNIEAEDVADMLSDFMEAEFQTLCEDNSCDEVGMILWKLFQLCKTGNETELQTELNKIPVSQCHEGRPFVYSTNVQDFGLSNVSETPEEENISGVMEQEDDEWTQVSTRRKRH